MDERDVAAGGKPNPGTKKDGRLKVNKPKTGNLAPPFTKKPPKKGK